MDLLVLMCRIGKELSGPLVSTLVGLLLSNLGVIGGGNAASVYDTVNKYILPLAIPLLLFSADLRYCSTFVHKYNHRRNLSCNEPAVQCRAGM